MACPKCGCKETYQYDHMEDCMIVADERFERCAACGNVFDIEDAAEEDDDEERGHQVCRMLLHGRTAA